MCVLIAAVYPGCHGYHDIPHPDPESNQSDSGPGEAVNQPSTTHTHTHTHTHTAQAANERGQRRPAVIGCEREARDEGVSEPPEEK